MINKDGLLLLLLIRILIATPNDDSKYLDDYQH